LNIKSREKGRIFEKNGPVARRPAHVTRIMKLGPKTLRHWNHGFRGFTRIDSERGRVYTDNMTIKEKVIKAVEGLADDASIEDVMERLLFLSKVERGLEQADTGQTMSHSQAKERMSKWLK
jgi:hypothetical protein